MTKENVNWEELNRLSNLQCGEIINEEPGFEVPILASAIIELKEENRQLRSDIIKLVNYIRSTEELFNARSIVARMKNND